MSDPLQPHRLQHTRLFCPLLSPKEEHSLYISTEGMDFSKPLFGQHFSHKFNMIFGCCTCNSPFISSNVPPSFSLVPFSAFSPYPGVRIYILFYPLSSGWIWPVVDPSKRTEVRRQWCWDTCSLSLLVCSLTQFLSRRLLL